MPLSFFHSRRRLEVVHMPEFFITARSFAAPFFSDTSERYVEADTPEEALEKFAADYSHPCGLYAAEVWTNADQFHKSKDLEPLARWKSNHLLAYEEAKAGKSSHSYLGHGPGDFEVNRERITVENPTEGHVVAA